MSEVVSFVRPQHREFLQKLMALQEEYDASIRADNEGNTVISFDDVVVLELLDARRSSIEHALRKYDESGMVPISRANFITPPPTWNGK